MSPAFFPPLSTSLSGQIEIFYFVKSGSSLKKKDKNLKYFIRVCFCVVPSFFVICDCGGKEEEEEKEEEVVSQFVCWQLYETS